MLFEGHPLHIKEIKGNLFFFSQNTKCVFRWEENSGNLVMCQCDLKLGLKVVKTNPKK